MKLRAKPSASRGLIAVLLVCLILGAVLVFNRVRSTSASVEPEPQPIATADTPAAPVTTVTPTTPAPTPARPTANPPARPIANPTPPPAPKDVVVAKILADARAKADAGDLLAARKLTNDALTSGAALSDPDANALRAYQSELNQTLIFSPRIFQNDTAVGTHVLSPGEVLVRIARQYDTPDGIILRLNNIADARRVRAGQKLKVLLGPVHAVVDKSDFRMDLWVGKPGQSGSVYLRSFKVGLGSDDSTPTGEWLCTPGEKLVNPQWTNPREPGVVIAGGDPKNPLGTRWIALQGLSGEALGQQSYGIHGTIEPHTIGTMASMGCIRLVNDEVELIYDILKDGKSTVTIIP